MKNLLFLIALVPGNFVHGQQNVGIGTNSPTQKLDVNGRMHIRHTPTNNQTAGIYYDGTATANRSFIGTLNDDHVGIYGAVAGWKLVMNVENGYVGIGNTDPGANLDVNGSLRFRGGAFPNQPHTGAMLTSIDDNGNTQWQRAVVFKTNGMVADVTLGEGTWTKLVFKSTGLEVNEGFYYDPTLSVFNAPVKGFYHFDANMLALSNTIQSYFRLVVVRNGSVIKDYRSQRHVNIHEALTNDQIHEYIEQSSKIRYNSYMISVSIPLEKNDQVWVEAYRSGYYGESESGIMKVKAGATDTWFSGFLVNRL